MHRTSTKKAIVVTLLLSIALIWAAGLPQKAHAMIGYIAAKGRVFGEHGKPIWAIYNDNGAVIWEKEAYGDPWETARVMSGGTWRAYYQAYQAVNSQYGHNMEILSRDEYTGRQFKKFDGSSLIKPMLDSTTVSVVVRKRGIYSNADLILHQSPLNLKGPLRPIGEDIASLLLTEGGDVIPETETTLNLGYRAAFYTLKGSSQAETTSSGWQMGQLEMSGFDRNRHQLWGPIQGAEIQYSFSAPTYSDADGYWHVSTLSMWSSVPFAGFLTGKLRYMDFDPHDRYTGIYYRTHLLYYGGAAIRYLPKIPVDVAMVMGKAEMRNEARPGTAIDSATSGSVQLGEQTVYGYTAPLFTPSGDTAGRLPDTPADFSDRGLVAQISTDDLNKTDVYIFRLSNDQLITSRKGLGDHDYAPQFGSEIDPGEGNASRIVYHMMIRGAASTYHWFEHLSVWNFAHYQEATGVNEALRGYNADHLRTGEQVKVVVVNRATGYIGTGIGEVGNVTGTNGSGKEVQDAEITVYIPTIVMRPPNLKIRAERVFDPSAGLTAGQLKTNLIGFEGSGLTSDKFIRVTSEWYDWDGTPLPADLPGYTGRLAKIVGSQHLKPVGGEIGNFGIKPGLHTQLVQLPGSHLDDAHFYIHVNGEPPEGNPDFSEIGAAEEGPLKYRPAHYVPFMVPLFDEAATLEVAQAQAAALKKDWQEGEPPPLLDNIEKIYRWPYRPEMQFSLFDLTIDPLEMVTTVDGTTGKTDTSLSFTYDLLQDPDYDPLVPLGPDRQLVFGLGYTEILAVLGEDQQVQFPSIEELMAMTPSNQFLQMQDLFSGLAPEDFLGLQLYQNSDAGNQLAEIYGLPLVVSNAGPKQIRRQYFQGKFDDSLPGTIGPGYKDSYAHYTFQLTDFADVSVRLLDSGKNVRGVLIGQTLLGPGPFEFIVDFDDLVDAGISSLSSRQFYVELKAKSRDELRKQTIYFPATYVERRNGRMLGQVMVHDVLLQDGSLNLSRKDFGLPGRGPALEFSRTYSNLPPGSGPHPLGTGWRHNYELRLEALGTPESSGTNSVPDWLTGLKSRFFRPGDMPAASNQWNAVTVNGTLFLKYNGAWYAERGRHGSLQIVGDEFVYTAKDGTKYYYGIPAWVYDDLDPIPVYMHTGDSLVTRIGLDQELLQLGTLDRPSASREWPAPAPIKRIVDRNGNQMTFDYDEKRRLDTVTDAVGRSLRFAYKEPADTDLYQQSFLEKVTGPDNLEVTLTYNNKGYLETVQRADRKESYAYAEEQPSLAGSAFNLISATDANDNTTSYDYYEEGELNGVLNRLIKAIYDYDVVKTVTYPGVATPAQFAYDAATDNKRTVTDLRGHDTTYYLNYHGNPIHTVEPLGKETFMTWSIDEGKNDNVMTSRTDGRGLTTTYKHDAKGNITEETDPYQNTIRTTWEQNFSVPLTRTDRNKVDQSWTYDGNGNMLTFEDGDHKTFSYTYYATGERQTVKDPRGNVTTYTYDAYGNPDTVTGPEGSVTDYDYDIRGRKVREEDPNHNPTTYAYNTLDQLTQVTYANLSAYNLPAGSSRAETMTYDPVGNLKTKKDRLGLTLTYTYTARNQVESITRSAGGAKHFGYDNNGNLTSETDWKGVATTHVYDALNRRTSTSNRLHHAMSMGYDENDNLTSRTDFEGHATTYVYDNLNRVTEIHQPDLYGRSVVTLRTYYDEADPDKNLRTETDPEANVTTYAYNGRYLRVSRIDALTHEHTWVYDDAGNLERETDEENNTTRHVYDKQNRLTDTYRSLDGREIHIAHNDYDAAGNLRFVTGPNDHSTETRYDQWNRAYMTIDAEGNETLVYLDSAGNKTYEKDAAGRERTWECDPRGWLTTYTDGEHNPTGYSYDDNGNVETVTYANNAVARTTYDAEDRETTVTEAYGSPIARTRKVLQRDKNGNPLKVQDFNGNITTTTYNVLNLVERVYDPAPFNANYIERTYYRTGKLKSERNRRGDPTDYEYDELNRVIKVTDALQQSVETTYDNVGNVKTVTDKRRIVTENFYDDLYRLVRTERAGTRLVTNEYDDAGNLTAVIDAENHRTEHSYYKNNRKRQTTFVGPVTDTTNYFDYDGVGNLLTLTDELGKETTYTYDNENRQDTVTFADETTTFRYDAMGNKIAEIRPRGNRRLFEYDLLNRLIRTVDDPDGMALATRFEHDANGNLLRQFDARNNQVEYTYDALNRKTAHIQHKSSGNLTVTYDTYDAEGNLTQMTDAMGREFGYTYDELNRQTRSTAPDIDSPYHQTVEVTTGYDENNNIVAVTETKIDESDNSFTDETVNTYDNFDRQETSTQRGLLTSYTYDGNGNRTSVTTPTGTTTYTFDARNRLKTAVADGTTTYAYRDDGLKESVTYSNGTQAAYTYNAANRIETITHSRTSDGSVISSYGYTYDANGNRTQQIEVQDEVSETTTYSYDDLDRLTDFTVAGTDTTVTAYTYEAYNRKTETVTENSTVTKQRSYTYDQTDWLTVIDDTTDAANPYTIAYTYDNNGNTLTKSDSSLTNQDETFAYDAFNRLVEARRGPSGSQTTLGRYDYNAAGLRIRHRLSERGDVDYFYDDNAVIEEHNATDDSLLAHYRYADRLISLDTGAGKQYYHHDALGSTVNLTTAAAAVQVSYRLDPWGHIRDQVGTSVNRQIFTGQEHDENTGLIYFGARYYDPDTARFITQDSYLGESNVPPSLHRYLYAYANPTVYVDLLGYDAVTLYKGKAYWAVTSKKGGKDVAYHPLGEYKEEDGKKTVYLTEEFGGGSVDFYKLSRRADTFWDRQLYVYDAEGNLQDDISGLSAGDQKGIIKSYIDYSVKGISEPTIQNVREKSFFDKWINPVDNIQEDLIALNHGAMRLDDFCGKYAFEAVVGYFGTKAGAQLFKKLNSAVARALERRFGKIGDDVVEKAIDEGANVLSEWKLPENWQGPSSSKGEWLGDIGNSGFKLSDKIADALNLPRGTIIDFVEGSPDFSKLHSTQGFFDVEGLTGVHESDRRLIISELAKELNTTKAEVRRWLAKNNLRMHHFKGKEIQLPDADIHATIHHTGSAASLRNNR